MRILCLEDSMTDFALIDRLLRNHFQIEKIERIETSEQLLQHLESSNWNLVISDFNLPQFNAKDALRIVREKCEDLPFIVLSGAIGEENVVDLLQSGAHDVVMKRKMARLPLAFERVQKEFNTRLSEKKAQKAKEEAIRAREEMLAIVSHDLRNPLAAIQLNGEAILRELKNKNLVQRKTWSKTELCRMPDRLYELRSG